MPCFVWWWFEPLLWPGKNEGNDFAGSAQYTIAITISTMPTMTAIAVRRRRSFTAATLANRLVARRLKRRDRPTPGDLVHDVDVLVLAIGAGDPEQHRQPPHWSQTTFAREGSVEDENVAEAIEIASRFLPHAVHVHLVTISHPGGKLHARALAHGHRIARPVRRRAFLLLFVCVAALAFAAVAWAGNGGFAPKTPASPNASGINRSYKLIALFTGLIFVLVEGTLVWLVFRFRRRKRPRTAEGPQVHGATRLELIWTAAPILVLAAIAAFVFYELPGIKNTPTAKAQGGPLEIHVVGRQFYWQFTYPNAAVSIEELHVPAHRVVSVDINSTDVVHSWWIPQLGGKFDAIPGRTNHTWFKAERPGTYAGQCGEFCGVFHAEMPARVVAGTLGDYTRYIASVRRPLVLGGQEWRGVCATCHGITGKGGYGPNIQSNSLLVQRAGLTRLLMEGQNVLKPVSSYMPPVGRGWTSAQITALMAFLKTHIYKPATSGG
jgi:cytochrome c oxidase subunit II